MLFSLKTRPECKVMQTDGKMDLTKLSVHKQMSVCACPKDIKNSKRERVVFENKMQRVSDREHVHI